MLSPSRLSVLALAALLGGGLGACSSCPSGSCAADAALESQVESRIDAVPALDGDDIQVQAQDRVVYLNGLVDTTAEAHEAASIARRQQGVRQVVNMLQERGNW